MKRFAFASLILVLSAVLSVSAQQPQSSTAPLFAVNSKYTNGVAPGYAPANGLALPIASLNLPIGKGTANCLGTLIEYAGGTLALADNATNYVYLNVGSSCAPDKNTSAFSSANIWIAKVTTSGGSITVIDDVRTGFLAPGTGSGTLFGSGTSGDLSYWTGASSLGDLTDFTYSTHTVAGGSSAILDLSGASIFKAPAKAGATAAADGQIAYDTTNKNTHVRANGADAILCPFASTPTTGHLIDTSVASSVVLCHDSGVSTANLHTGSGTSGDLSYWTGASSLGDLTDFTYSTHTVAGGSSAILDLSGASIFKAPAKAGATAAADGQIAYDTTNKNTHVRANGADAIDCPFPSTPTTGHLVDTSVASSVVLCHDSGVSTADVLHAASPALGYAHFPGSSQVPTSVTIPRAIPFTIGDPAGSALTATSTTTDYVTVPFACTISAYSLVLAPSGTITVKFWKVATGTAIPTSSNSISTSGVGISSGAAVKSTSLGDFTSTTITAYDIMAMNVTAVGTAAYVNGVLTCDESQ